MNVLKEITDKKRDDLISLKSTISINDLMKNVCTKEKPQFFRKLESSKSKYKIIPETKKSSPSAGQIVKIYDPVENALSYKKSGFSVLSVLTEQHYFGGDINDIGNIKSEVDVKILRKDFIVDEWQIYESKAFGADCILLISESLSLEEILDFSCIASDLNLDVLLEFHKESELEKVLRSELKLIGINNRNLETITTNINHCESLLNKYHKDLNPKKIIAESGFSSKLELDQYVDIGVNKFLIGEGLLKNTLF